MGRLAERGKPEDLLGCSRTVFGVKILCGLIAPINPQSSEEGWGFFIFMTNEPQELRSHGASPH
jgi:hypothetical protein